MLLFPREAARNAEFYQYARDLRSNIQTRSLKPHNEDQRRPETSVHFAGHRIKFNCASAGGRLVYP